jgi:hypothetical protein
MALSAFGHVEEGYCDAVRECPASILTEKLRPPIHFGDVVAGIGPGQTFFSVFDRPWKSVFVGHLAS